MRVYKIIVFLLFVNPYFAIGQTKLNNIKSIFYGSDSIQIVSHESLQVIGKPGKSNIWRKIVKEGKPNNQIIREVYTLDKTSKNRLLNILLTPNNDSLIEVLSCFEPHHSILIFKKGKCSYFDICFRCRHFITSKDIKINQYLLSDKAWKDLEEFYLNNNIVFEMPKHNLPIE